MYETKNGKVAGEHQSQLVKQLFTYKEDDNHYPVLHCRVTQQSHDIIISLVRFIMKSNNPKSEIMQAIYRTFETQIEKELFYRFTDKQLNVFINWLSHYSNRNVLNAFMAEYERLKNMGEAESVANDYNNNPIALAGALIQCRMELENMRQKMLYFQERVPKI